VTIPNVQPPTPNRREFLGVVGALGATAVLGDFAWASHVIDAYPNLMSPGLGVGPARSVITVGDGPWVSLFDGTTLNGWRGYRKPDAASTRWKVEDGMLTVDPAGGHDTRGALDLITTGTYDEFELAWEWKIAPGGNSGVKYFVLEDRDSAIGHEYQIIDDERHADAKIGAHRQTAALYDVLPAADRPLKPAGEFNESRIVVVGRHVEHWLNGRRVLQYELAGPELQSAVDRSKFKGIDRFGKPQKGYVLLQDHGDRAWYRNIRIRRTGSGGA